MEEMKESSEIRKDDVARRAASIKRKKVKKIR